MLTCQLQTHRVLHWPGMGTTQYLARDISVFLNACSILCLWHSIGLLLGELLSWAYIITESKEELVCFMFSFYSDKKVVSACCEQFIQHSKLLPTSSVNQWETVHWRMWVHSLHKLDLNMTGAIGGSVTWQSAPLINFFGQFPTRLKSCNSNLIDLEILSWSNCRCHGLPCLAFFGTERLSLQPFLEVIICPNALRMKWNY